jgi:hypothetical protein
MIGAMKHIPAVTINARHRNILARILSGLKGFFFKPSNWSNLLHFGGKAISIINPGIGAVINDSATILDEVIRVTS